MTKLKKATGKICVEPSNHIFLELGNNTYDYKDLISELIDNAVSARRLGLCLNVAIELHVDNQNKPKSIVISDNASGILSEKLGQAVSPAAIQTANSLNEHGLGMKQAVAALGKLDYLATKTLGESKARVIREFKYGDVEIFEADFNSDSGTEIRIVEPKPIMSTNPQFITMSLVPYLGASLVYR
jgi:hypothetical protein